MKTIFYSLTMLAAAFLLGACQNEKLGDQAQKATVSFTVEAPGVFTKAIADGTNVDQLIYEVWSYDMASKSLVKKLFQDRTTLTLDGGVRKTTLPLELLNDQQYAVLFWAQVSTAAAYTTTNLTSVTYAKAMDAYSTNDEDLAAFYAVAYINDGAHVTADDQPTDGTVVLRRPFAQLNIGTINKTLNNTGSNRLPYTISLYQSSMTITGVATTFNVFDGSVSGDETMELQLSAVPSDPSTLTISGKNDVYYYAAMTYLFAGDVVDVDYCIKTKLNNDDTFIAEITNNVPTVRLKENYRTNIIGNLLTTSATYEIIVDKSWANETDEPYIEEI